MVVSVFSLNQSRYLVRSLRVVAQPFSLCVLCLAVVLCTACAVRDLFPRPAVKPLADTGYLLDGPPENPGYLVSVLGKEVNWLTVFDADTFEVFRTVRLLDPFAGYLDWVEIGPDGRVWVGYVGRTYEMLGTRPRSGVMVFSPEGDLEHDLDLKCGLDPMGVAFADEYAFVGCAVSGFAGMVVVVDMGAIEVVKVFDEVHPPGEDSAEVSFFINAVAEVAGFIVVVGDSTPPRGHQRPANHPADYTRVGVIDPGTLEFRGFLTGLEPGLEVNSVLEVDGKAWLFNSLSHWEEEADRTDVYVMDVLAMEVTNSFNLERPFPRWAEWGDNGVIHILHETPGMRRRQAGHPSGVTRLDTVTGRQEFVALQDLTRVTGMGVYRDRICLSGRFGKVIGRQHGLWCSTVSGELELKIPECCVTGIAFKPSS